MLRPTAWRPKGRDACQHRRETTTWRFTGQREDCRTRTIGLYFYNARFYDPLLGRFAQADTIVPNPGDPQSLNRYSYTLNNPLRYTDPTGHYAFEDGPEDPFFVNPDNSPTGQPMVIAEPCNLGGCQEATTAELVMVATFPIWVAGGGLVAAEAAIFDVAVPAAVSVIGHIAGLLGLGACGDGDCTNEASGVVDFARSLQGSGRYPGVDKFGATVLHEGETVVGGLPGQSHFYTSMEALQQAGGFAEALWKGLQVAQHAEKGYRTVVGVYRVVTDVSAATGQALANPAYGPGGFTQFVVENYQQALELLYTVTLQ